MTMIVMYDMQGKPVAPMEKTAAHERMREEYEQGCPTVKDHHINIILMNPLGELLVYQRGQSEEDNPGLIDKLGTHLPYHPDADLMTLPITTAYEEVARRLGTEVVIASPSEVSHVLREHRENIDTDTTIIWPGPVYEDGSSIRVVSDGRWVNPNITTRVFGYCPATLPNEGYRFVAPSEVAAGINRPRVFTDDLRDIVKIEARLLVSLDEALRR